MQVSLDEVYESSWTLHELLRGLVVQVKGTINHLICQVTHYLHDWLKLSACNLLHGLLCPTLTPDDHTLAKKCWVLGTVGLELRVGVVKTDHYREVLLDPAHKELEQSPALILIPHLILELGQ